MFTGLTVHLTWNRLKQKAEQFIVFHI